MVETKFFDTQVTDQVVATGGTILSSTLNAVAQGVGESDRVGREVLVSGLEINGRVLLPSQASGSGATFNAERVRILVYIDTQANGAAIASTGRLLEPNTIYGHFNEVEQDRIDIIADHTVDLFHRASIAQGPRFAAVVQSFSLHIPLEVTLDYNNATGAITSLTSNNIGVAAWSDYGDNEVTYNARLYYED